MLRGNPLECPAPTEHGRAVCSRGISDRPQAARTPLYTVRTDNTPSVRFSATLGQEPEIEVALAWRLGARALPHGAACKAVPRSFARGGSSEVERMKHSFKQVDTITQSRVIFKV